VLLKKSRCLLWEPYGTHRYTLWAECSIYKNLVHYSYFKLQHIAFIRERRREIYHTVKEFLTKEHLTMAISSQNILWKWRGGGGNKQVALCLWRIITRFKQFWYRFPWQSFKQPQNYKVELRTAEEHVCLLALFATHFTLVSCLAYSSELNIWRWYVPPESRFDFQRTTRCYIKEYGTLHNHSCENHKSYDDINYSFVNSSRISGRHICKRHRNTQVWRSSCGGKICADVSILC
jgi:hypothetical protein